MGIFGESGDREYRYVTARICRNGHIREEDIRGLPPEPRCVRCGAENLEACLNCNEPIRGPLESAIAEGATGYELPNYCHRCGAAHTWTQTRIDALTELVKHGGVPESVEERAQLISDLPNLITDTGRTELTAMRMKRWLQRVAPDAGRAARELLLNVATDAVKKLLFGP